MNTGEIIPGAWRTCVQDGLPPIPHQGSRNYAKAAENIRSKLTTLFWEKGAIPQQWLATGLSPEVVDCDEPRYEYTSSDSDSDSNDLQE